MVRKLWALVIFCVCNVYAEEVVHTLYGDFTITEHVLCELLHNPFVERLQSIHQYGINAYSVKKPDFSRYIHSVGVMVLLRKYEAPVCEQIAGLLHDVSHTVFSHVGDRVFDCHAQKSSYQDNIHKKFLEQTTIPGVLAKYEYVPDDILHKNTDFKRLEQDLPDICADRLEYILRGGFAEGVLSKDDIKTILDDLCFEDGVWYFVNEQSALKLARTSIYLPEHIWFSPENQFADHCAAQALKRAAAIGILTYDDIHFSIDDIVWHKLNLCQDSVVHDWLAKLNSWSTAFVVGTKESHDFWCSTKSQAINPWVKTKDGLKRLADVSTVYAAEYARSKELLTPGFYFKYV